MPAPTPDYVAPHGLLGGKTVVVTAAAGTGIGYAVARRCAEEGARVLISDIHERRLAEAVDRMEAETGWRPPSVVCNVTQQADEIDRAAGKIVDSLLPVLDACEAAFAHQVQGIESIWSALIGALQKHGLEALDLAEQPFDPAVAEAVMHEPGDGGADGPVVAEVLRTGYVWKGKVLRPAMVKVRG